MRFQLIGDRAARDRIEELTALPQTCGKIERLCQTLKRYLAKQPPANNLTELQVQLDTFVHYYNDIRPHRALDGRTPLQAYSARIKAKPANGASQAPTHLRVRQDKRV